MSANKCITGVWNDENLWLADFLKFGNYCALCALPVNSNFDRRVDEPGVWLHMK